MLTICVVVTVRFDHGLPTNLTWLIEILPSADG